MALLTVNAIDKTGISQSATAVAADVAGDSVAYTSSLFVSVYNGDASPHTVTIAAPVSDTNCGNYGSLPVSDIVINIPASEERSFRVPSGYSVNGLLSWTYDAVTSVTVGVFS